MLILVATGWTAVHNEHLFIAKYRSNLSSIVLDWPFVICGIVVVFVTLTTGATAYIIIDISHSPLLPMTTTTAAINETRVSSYSNFYSWNFSSSSSVLSNWSSERTNWIGTFLTDAYNVQYSTLKQGEKSKRAHKKSSLSMMVRTSRHADASVIRFHNTPCRPGIVYTHGTYYLRR